MKLSKVITPIVLVGALGASWMAFFYNNSSTYSEYRDYIKNAESSIEAGLYEQAIEYYKKSLEYEMSEKTYEKIMETYDTLYDEEDNSYIFNMYVTDMAEASKKYPENEDFWMSQINLYLEEDNYKKAYETVTAALNRGAEGKELDRVYNKLIYMVEIDYQLYYDYSTALNGYISVSDGSMWTVLDDNADSITGTYYFAGLINDDGKGIYTNHLDTRILDSTEVPRARFDLDVEEAGCYDEATGLTPVKVDGVWRYVNTDGEFYMDEYEVAGSFYNNKTVAKSGDKWMIIDNEENSSELKNIEDVKLDLYGRYIQSDIIIAKEKGKYHLYDKEFEKISDFEADDIDICINSGNIAFEKNGKWGFVNTEGEIVIKPEYSKAKSFSNGYAAVCNEDGKWGFITTDNKLVIDYEYNDAFYFTAGETCLVSMTEGTVQFLRFMF